MCVEIQDKGIVKMKKTQKVKWQGVSLPVPFINDIKNHIKDKNEYKNVPAFVIDAIREKMAIDKFSTSPPIRDMILKKSRDPVDYEFQELNKKIERLSKNIITRDDLKEFTELLLHDLGFKTKEDKKKNDNNGVRI